MTKNDSAEITALDSEIKTVIQISQYIDGQFMKGSKTHTIHGRKAYDIINLVKSLKKEFKKISKSIYIVRVQISEYSKTTGAYRKQQGSCITLYNTTSLEVYDRIGETINIPLEVDIKKIEEFTSAEGTDLDGYYNVDTHKDLWCLCKQEKANSKVLHTSDDPRDLIPMHDSHDGFTYWLNPDGKLLLKKEINKLFINKDF